MPAAKLKSFVELQKIFSSTKNKVFILFLFSYVLATFSYVQVSFLVSLHFAREKTLYALLAMALSCQPLGTALIILLKLKYIPNINVRSATTGCEMVGCVCTLALSFFTISDDMAFFKLLLLTAIGISNAFYVPYVAYAVKILGDETTYKPMSGALATGRGAAAAAGPLFAAISARIFGISLALLIVALVLLVSTVMLIAMWRRTKSTIQMNMRVNMSALSPGNAVEPTCRGRPHDSPVMKVIWLSCGINGLLIGPTMLLGYRYAATTPKGDLLWAQALGFVGVSAMLLGILYSVLRHQGSVRLIAMSILFANLFCISVGWNLPISVILICSVLFGGGITIAGITFDTWLQLSVNVDEIAYFSGLDTAFSAIALSVGYAGSALAISMFNIQAVSVGISMCGVAIAIFLLIAGTRYSITQRRPSLLDDCPHNNE